MWTPGTNVGAAGELVEADAVERVRIEHAIPRWGTELTTNTLPPRRSAAGGAATGGAAGLDGLATGVVFGSVASATDVMAVSGGIPLYTPVA